MIKNKAMIEKLILQYLQKISLQLEEVAKNQDTIKEEIFKLQQDINRQQEYTNKLEDTLGVADIRTIVN